MLRQHISRTKLACLAAVVLALISSGAPAQEPAGIQRLVDQQTILAARVRLERIQVDEIAKLLARQLPNELVQTTPWEEHVEREVENLRSAGVAEIYLLLDLVTAGHGPVIALAPPTSEANKRAVLEVLERAGLPRVQEIGGMLVAGQPPAVEYLARAEPADRPELAAAWQSLPEADVVIALLPTRDARRVMDETLRLPAELGGQEAVNVIADIQWVALGVHLPPQFRATMRVQAADAPSADKIEHLVQSALKWAAAQKQWPQEHLERVRSQLTITQRESQLDVAVEEKERQSLSALFRPFGAARENARRQRCANNLKQIAIAMHNYHDTYVRFPAAASYDAEGKPLLSWRVHLLPFVDQAPLYKEFHLDEPWDSEHNRKLIERMPAVWACPSATLKPGLTTYRVPTGATTAFAGKEGIRIRDIPDGTSNTLMVIEVPVEQATVWTKPDDYQLNLENLPAELAKYHDNSFNAALFDGSVRAIPSTIEANTLRLLLDPDDRTPVPPF